MNHFAFVDRVCGFLSRVDEFDVDVNQKQKDVSSFVDIYNTKRWKIESPGNQTTGSRPAHDGDISQADINPG